MFQVNSNFEKLQGNYLFAEVARRTAEFRAAHPEKEPILLGIGDVTRPLPPAVVEAMKKAADEMGSAQSFRGYGPYEGYDFLLEAIAGNDYAAYGVDVGTDEIFVSDGAKSDTANIQELFSAGCRVAVTDPVYPVYVDTNVMAGRAGGCDRKTGRYAGITYLPTTAENGFVPALPEGGVEAVYLCSPNNPTGMALRTADMKKWVDWANANGSLLLVDAAYDRFITEDGVPHSVYEIEGAKTCAIEFRSYSKTAGFTGTRCAYTVVPKALKGRDAAGGEVSLNELWLRRQSTKYNGVSYIIQRGAEAVYSAAGREQVDATVRAYLENAAIIKRGLERIGITAYGGVNSPYVWLKTPGGLSSWDFFDKLLGEANVVGTPGSGFGSAGEGYFRLTAFNTKENTERAIERLGRLSL
jgi:LL-diaminopimelate aminotransferase